MTRVAIQGARGSFSEEAARSEFANAEILQCRTFDDAAAALENGGVDYAVLPVENKIAGAVPGVANIVADPKFRKVNEIVLPATDPASKEPSELGAGGWLLVASIVIAPPVLVMLAPPVTTTFTVGFIVAVAL